MTGRLILATSMLVLAMSSEAFAYSNVSPKEVPQKTISVRQSLQSSFALGRTMGSRTIDSDRNRYAATLRH
jgi:hypothetical protein